MAALLVLLCAACTELEGPSDEGWTELGGDSPVKFSTSLPTTSTKTTTTLPFGTAFGVFAFSQPGTPGNTGTWDPNTRTPNLMFNQAVTFNSDGSYTYAPIKFWPNSTYNTITFWAYCPYNPTDDNIQFVKSGTTDTQYTVSSTGYPDIKYTVNTGTTDLLAAAPVTDQSKPANDAPVNFEFHHALSKINFKFNKVNDSGDAYTIKVTSISFINVNLTGIHGSAGWRDWSNPCDNEHPFVAYSGDPIDVTYKSTDTPDFPESPNCSVMLIPQDVETSNAILRVNYSVSMGSNPAQHYEGECLLTGSWLEEKQHTYKISISPGNPIIFSASITPWDENVVNGYKYIVN